jgi:hypothetical protein
LLFEGDRLVVAGMVGNGQSLTAAATNRTPAARALGPLLEAEPGLQFAERDSLPLAPALNHSPEFSGCGKLQILTIVTLDPENHRTGPASACHEHTFSLSGIKQTLHVLLGFSG